MLGNDAAKDFVLKDLEEAGVAVHGFIDRTRPTTQKERFIADGHKMLQVDRVDNRAVSDRALRFLSESMDGQPSRRRDLQRLPPRDLPVARASGMLRERVPAGALKVADSQVSNRWGNILDFTDFDLLTPNEREARFALGDQDSVVRPLALQLFRLARCKHLILKLGRARHSRLPDARAHAARVLHGGQPGGYPRGPGGRRRRAPRATPRSRWPPPATS